MTTLRKTNFIYTLLAAIILAVVPAVHATDFDDESLNYRVMYKWGLVNKQAGTVNLSLSRTATRYNTQLTARSEKWADHFYKVRDTLTCIIDHRSFRPLEYQKRSHEGGDHKHDVVTYSYTGNTVTGHCSRKKWNKKYKLVTDETRTLTATGMTLDMMSAFYFMRNRPYASWNTGLTQSVNLFSGKRKEILTITYLGIEKVKVDKTQHECYHITFTFTDPDNKKQQSSDAMEAWISTAADRVPIKLEGNLKVGKVQCFFTGRDE